MTDKLDMGTFFQEIHEKAANKDKARQAEKATPLELARARRNAPKADPVDSALMVSPTRMEPTKEVTRGWLEEIGWDELDRLNAEHGERIHKGTPDEASEPLASCMARSSFLDGALAAKQVLALKAGTSTRIKAKEARIIEDFVKWHSAALNEQIKHLHEKMKASRYETLSINGSEGPLYTDRTTLKRMATSIVRGRDFILTGEPGVAKTEFALSLGPVVNREVYLMEMSGMSDPSQLIAQQHLEEKNGATITVSRPTPLIKALEAAEAGREVILVLDEFPRVTDPMIHNPLLLLMSHRTFSDNIHGKQYRVDRDKFVIIATANFDAGRNFSGNNRRGVDDASMDRLRVIRVNRPPRHVIPEIVDARVDMYGLSEKARGNVLKAAEELYALANTPETQRLITVRSVILIVDAWVSLDPRYYSLGEAVQLELEHRPGTDPATLTGITSALELKGL